MIRKIIVFLYASAILLVPLILSAETSEMFEIPKMFFIYIIGVSIFALFLLDFFKNSRSIKLSRVHILVLVFLTSQIASYFFSIDKNTSFFGYYGRFNGGVLSSFIFAIYFFVASQLLNDNLFRFLLKASVFASVLVILWGLPGRFLGKDMACIYFRGEFSNECWTNDFRPAERMFSTLGQPNWLGTYFAAHVFIGLFLFLSGNKSAKGGKKNNSRFLLLVYSALMFFGVYLTGSRSSIISVVVPVVIEILIRASKKINRSIFFLMLAIMIFVVAVGSTLYATSVIKNTKSDITHSGKIRLIVWEGALRLWAKYPVFGTGPETFAYAYYQTRPEAHNYTTEKDFIYNKAHNEFLNMLSTTGTFGFASYSILIIYSIYLLFKKSHVDRIVAYGLISISISNFFGFSTSTSQIILYILISFAAYREIDGNKVFKFDLNYLSSRFFRLPIIFLTISGWVYLAIFFQRYIIADITYAASQNTYENGSPIQAVTLCLEAYEIKKEHIYADKCASIAASTALLLADAESEELIGYRENFIDLTNSLSSLALRASPQNPIYIKSRLRVIKALMKVDPKNKSYEKERSALIRKFRQLAPTDTTVF